MYFTPNHLSFCCADDFLRKFWEEEDYNLQQSLLSLEEQVVVNYFEKNHGKDETGRFIVPLPMKNDVISLGKSRSLVAKQFKGLGCSLKDRSQF